MNTLMNKGNSVAGFIYILLFALLINPLGADESTTTWKLEKDEDGVKIFTREISGSQLKEFKGLINIKTSLESLVALYYDRKSCPEWIFACENSEVLKEISVTEKYIYTESGAPWPVDHRDVIIHSVLSQNADTKEVVITEEGISGFIPEKSDCVRMPQYNGYYKFRPLDGDMVEVTFQCHSNPGGSLPGFLVNVAVVDNPFDTLSNMREIVQKDKYRNAIMSFIQ